MAIVIERDAYPTYFMNGTNFRTSVRDPKSYLRTMIDLLSKNGNATKVEFYLFADRLNAFDEDGRLRGGFSAWFWTAATRAGLIADSGKRTPSGSWVYEKGPRFEFWKTLADLFSGNENNPSPEFLEKMAKFFTKTHTETIWFYRDESEIPNGWRVVRHIP